MKFMLRSAILFASFSAIFLLTACAGTKVENVNRGDFSAAQIAPETIAVRVTNSSPPPKKEKRRAAQREDANLVASRLETDLQRILVSHKLRIVSSNENPDLVLNCVLLDVAGGNPTLRAMVGYGAGKTVIKTNISLIDPLQQGAALLTFQVSGTTGAMPGSALGGITLLFRKEGNPELNDEIEKTSQNIEDQIGKYFSYRGWPY